MHDIMAGGCCPINTRGDKDIYGRKFSLPVKVWVERLESGCTRARGGQAGWAGRRRATRAL